MKITGNLAEKIKDVTASLFLISFLGLTLVDTFAKGGRLVLENFSHSTINGRTSDHLIFKDGTKYEFLCPGEKNPNHPYRGQVYRKSPIYGIIHPLSN